MRDEQPPSATADDRYWEALVSRLRRDESADRESPCAAELEELEQRLAATQGEPLPASVVDAIVRDVTGHRGSGRAAARITTWPRALRAAAVVTFMAALTAAVLNLVWPEGVRSRESLDYTVAVELLRRPDQPVESQRSALAQARSRVERGIAVLIEVRDDASNDSVLRDAAAAQLRDLAALLATPSRAAARAAPDDDTLAQTVTIARSPIAATAARRSAVDLLAAYAGAGLVAIRDASTALPALQDEVDVVRAALVRSLAR